jgi:acetyl esterase/lipase
MKKQVSLLLAMLTIFGLSAQRWVDKQFNITADTGLIYGNVTDFFGRSMDLRLDVTYPTNDLITTAGRPLMIVIHGGAFIAGSRKDASIVNIMKDFAQRGYVTASIQYRLGLYHANKEIGSIIPGRSCVNAADTLEWYRAVYRSMQDVKGAIRYMVGQKWKYNIDPQRIFLVGESAGGFAALAATFLDMPDEKPFQADNILPAPKPIDFYLSCVQQLAISSYQMANLNRPDLGSIDGPLNPLQEPYRIRGVGSLYGAMMTQWLDRHKDPDQIPVLFMFHQPNDLVVPYGTQKAFQGISDCGVGIGNFPIINNPYISGSFGIKKKIDAMTAAGQKTPKYRFETTNNTADCLGQTLDPSKTGHALDNYTLRTQQMAQFFAETVLNSAVDAPAVNGLKAYPNPVIDHLYIDFEENTHVDEIALFDMAGRRIWQQLSVGLLKQWQLPRQPEWPKGLYGLLIRTDRGSQTLKIMMD